MPVCSRCIFSSPRRATIRNPSAMRYTRRPRTSSRVAKSTTPFIPSSTVRRNRTIGQTQRSGKKPIRPSASRLVLTRSRMPASRQNRTPARRTPFGSFALTSGSNRRFAGCRWTSGTGASLPSARMIWRVVSATAVWICPLPRILRRLCWCSHLWTKRINHYPAVLLDTGG